MDEKGEDNNTLVEFIKSYFLGMEVDCEKILKKWKSLSMLPIDRSDINRILYENMGRFCVKIRDYPPLWTINMDSHYKKFERIRFFVIIDSDNYTKTDITWMSHIAKFYGTEFVEIFKTSQMLDCVSYKYPRQNINETDRDDFFCAMSVIVGQKILSEKTLEALFIVSTYIKQHPMVKDTLVNYIQKCKGDVPLIHLLSHPRDVIYHIE